MSKDSRLGVNLLGISMKTPVLTASGTFGFGEEYTDFVDLSRLGGVIVKCITLQPRKGNEGIRITETSQGMLNAIGLENPGIDSFISDILPRIKKLGMNIIVNISGGAVEEYGELARKLDVNGIAAIELNISCPNVKDGGIIFGTDMVAATEVVAKAKASTSKPVIVKLSPNVTSVANMAKAIESAGADAISLINTLIGMQIDIDSWKPTIGNITGGLSGPCVKPVALRMVWEVSKVVNIPIIGMGGIASANDAVEFLLAGANAVAVGTANFIDPSITMKICDGLNQYLIDRDIDNVTDIVGKAHVNSNDFT